jgi:hypothetical protein
MSKKRHTSEQIIGKLREAEVLLAQGQTVPAVSRSLGIDHGTDLLSLAQGVWRLAGGPGETSEGVGA